MQRAAASSPATSSNNLQTPSTEPLAKRRRIESAASSPSVSTPGTPASGAGGATPVAAVATPSAVGTAAQASSFGAARGGTSIFNRGEGDDTEWVLETKVKIPANNVKTPRSNGRGGAAGSNPVVETKGSRFQFGEEEDPADDDDEDDEDDPEEDDIWNNQPRGRQTYGSFKQKRKSKDAARDSNSASDSDDDDDDDDDDEDDSELDDNARRRGPGGKGHKPSSSRGGKTKDIDSDEEMRQVRRAIEQKHRNMMGTGTPGGGGGPKRRREEGNYKAKKKARKTI